jgi:hypothetical protein
MLSRMPATIADVPANPARPNLLTLASIGAIACIAADMVHEAVGHGLASWLTGDRLLFLSTVATQNASPNRTVSAAGTGAEIMLGIFSLLLLRRTRKLTPFAYFLWIFAAFSLFNTGYLVVSAISNSSDWANVIAGLSPSWLWRCLLAFIGAILYVFAFRWIASFLIGWVNRAELARSDVWRLVWPAYLAGGAAMTFASVFNPISPALILLSGVGASFGLNCGLLFLPGVVANHAGSQTVLTCPIPFRLFWIVFAVVTAGIFVAVLGPGIRFPQ